MRVLTAEGAVYGGANAILFLARQILWAWPVYFCGRLPGSGWLLDAGYGWSTKLRRRCSTAQVQVEGEESLRDVTDETGEYLLWAVETAFFVGLTITMEIVLVLISYFPKPLQAILTEALREAQAHTVLVGIFTRDAIF